MRNIAVALLLVCFVEPSYAQEFALNFSEPAQTLVIRFEAPPDVQVHWRLLQRNTVRVGESGNKSVSLDLTKIVHAGSYELFGSFNDHGRGHWVRFNLVLVLEGGRVSAVNCKLCDESGKFLGTWISSFERSGDLILEGIGQYLMVPHGTGPQLVIMQDLLTNELFRKEVTGENGTVIDLSKLSLPPSGYYLIKVLDLEGKTFADIFYEIEVTGKEIRARRAPPPQ